MVGLDLEERRVLGDDVACGDQHLDDLGLGQALAEVGQDEGPRHQNARVSRAAATTRGTSGTVAFSRAKPANATSYAVTRRTGASSERNAPSMIEAAVSAPGPKRRGASWTTTARPVFATEATSVARSSGEIVSRARTSTLAPSPVLPTSAPPPAGALGRGGGGAPRSRRGRPPSRRGKAPSPRRRSRGRGRGSRRPGARARCAAPTGGPS